MYMYIFSNPPTLLYDAGSLNVCVSPNVSFWQAGIEKLLKSWDTLIKNINILRCPMNKTSRLNNLLLHRCEPLPVIEDLCSNNLIKPSDQIIWCHSEPLQHLYFSGEFNSRLRFSWQSFKKFYCPWSEKNQNQNPLSLYKPFCFLKSLTFYSFQGRRQLICHLSHGISHRIKCEWMETL